MPPEHPEELGHVWAAELDRHHVSRAVLIASLPGDEASVEAAVRTHPERFHGFFMANPMAPGAVESIAATLARGAMQGVCLFPAMHRYSLHEDAVVAVLEAAASHPGVVVFVHCGVLSVGVRKKLGLPSLFDLRFSNPVDLHAHALRFPKLNFIVPHFGAGYFRETLMLADLCPNVYIDTSSSNGWMRYEEAGCTLRNVFQRTLAVTGPRRLLFGTDSSFFPRGWHASVLEDQARALYELGLAEADARAILHDNLERLLARPAA